MIDFRYSPLFVGFSIFLWAMMRLILRPTKTDQSGVSDRIRMRSILICICYCLFSFNDTDWFHYQELFPGLKLGWKGHMEEIYVWIAQNLSPNYIVFRLVVWGSAFFLYLRTIKLLSVSKQLALYFFGTIYIIWFAYARVSLAMALVYYGYALWNSEEKRIIAKMIALCAIGASYFFHKSALFAVAIAIVAVFMQKFPKQAIWMMLLSFPIVIVIARTQLAAFAMLDLDSADSDMASYMASGQNYMDASKRTMGIGAMLYSFCERFSYYGIAFVNFRCLRSQNILFIPRDIKAFMLLQLAIVAVSSIFAFDLGQNTSTLYVRLLRFAGMPTAIVMAYLYEHRLNWILMGRIITLATCGVGYILLYSFYISCVS